MNSQWQPVNEVEQTMVAALEDGDSQRYVAVLAEAPLFCPASGRGGWRDSLGLPEGHFAVFTSPDTMSGVLKDVANEHERVDLESLRRNLANTDSHLVINPGTPVAVLLPVDAIDQLARGDESLVSLRDIQDAVLEEICGRIRAECIAELSRSAETDPVSGDENGDETDAERVVAELRHAVDQKDADAFLNTLLGSDVVVPTAAPVAAADEIAQPEFPWLTVGEPSAPIIPVFSSTAWLNRLASRTDRITVPFVDVLINWPSEEHLLCLNPGRLTELILSGESMAELLIALADAFDAEQENGRLSEERGQLKTPAQAGVRPVMDDGA